MSTVNGDRPLPAGNVGGSFRKWHVLLFVVLALLLVGAKGCKKKQGVYKAKTANGDVYWYYVGENNWDPDWAWGGALWCQSAKPDGPPPHWCNADYPVSIDVKKGEITCTVKGGGGVTIGCRF